MLAHEYNSPKIPVTMMNTNPADSLLGFIDS